MTDRQCGHPTLSSPARRALTPAMRLIGLAAVLVAQLLYVPLNRAQDGGVALETPWDALVPLWPIWVIPYVLAITWWVASLAWAAWKMEDRRYRALIIAVLATMLTAYVVYILFPTYVVRPVPEGNSWAANLLRTVYAHDDLYNAFPSGHTYNTMLIVFFWWDWQPRLRGLWLAIAVVILLSTLFTGQHNLVDPLGGIVWAWLGSRFGWWATRRGAER